MNLFDKLVMSALAFAFLACAASTGFATDPCDGSNPTTGKCGTFSLCANGTNSEIPVTCTGNEINQVSGQFACTGATGSGSTKCGDGTGASEPCTTKKACENAENLVNGVTVFFCHAPGAASTNSTRVKKDNIVCNDTTE